MPFIVVEIELREGQEIWREELPTLFETRLEAWQTACERAQRGSERGLAGGSLDYVWVREEDSEFRYYVHEPGRAPARIVAGSGLPAGTARRPASAQ